MRHFGQSRKRNSESNSNRRKRANLSCSFERLEQRAFMASDLMAYVNNGILTINGGNESDEIQIIGTGNPDEYTVIAGADPQHTQATINGQAQQTFSGVSKIYLSLADGNNWISIQDIRIDNIEIHTGSDADEIIIGKHIPLPASGPNATNIIIGNLLDVYSGGGDDRVTIGRVFGDHNLTRVTLGEGNDIANLYNGSFLGIIVEGGEGDDQISVGFALAEDGGFGGDNGNDLISVYCSRFKEFGAGGENGSDTVAIDTIQVTQEFYIPDDDYETRNYAPGDFNDTLLVARSNINAATMYFQNGHNTYIIGKYYDFDASNKLVLVDGGCTFGFLRVTSDWFDHEFDASIENQLEVHGCVINHVMVELNEPFGNNDILFSSCVIDNLEMNSSSADKNRLTRIYNSIASEDIENFTEL